MLAAGVRAVVRLLYAGRAVPTSGGHRKIAKIDTSGFTFSIQSESWRINFGDLTPAAAAGGCSGNAGPIRNAKPGMPSEPTSAMITQCHR
jgi:hypothetical protein